MSGYPNPWKMWNEKINAGNYSGGGPGLTTRQEVINFLWSGSLNGILGRGSTDPKMQNYAMGNTCTSNLRWDERSSENAMSRRKSRVASNNIAFAPSFSMLSPLAENIDQTLVPGQLLGAQTPFRAMMNAGDPGMSYNSNIYGPARSGDSQLDPLYTTAISQVSSSRRASNAGWRNLAGSIHIGGESLWTGNQKFVYDGSDYVTFKKLQAKNRNYNDPTFGGDQYNASQVALARVRH